MASGEESSSASPSAAQAAQAGARPDNQGSWARCLAHQAVTFVAVSLVDLEPSQNGKGWGRADRVRRAQREAEKDAQTENKHSEVGAHSRWNTRTGSLLIIHFQILFRRAYRTGHVTSVPQLLLLSAWLLLLFTLSNSLVYLFTYIDIDRYSDCKCKSSHDTLLRLSGSISYKQTIFLCNYPGQEISTV